ncbi:MAG: sigma-70 family RNA polymerase sigma factor [Acidimicrobiia bacterium]|nr:sigma-70 family RNA polymerase sigma factor [Acidimicrobiia bacterium]
MATSPSTDERFQSLFTAHHKELHAYCLRRLPVEDANEAASEIFLVAWRRADDVPTGGGALLWLYGVARNVVRNWQRSGRRQLRLVAKSGAMVTEHTGGPEVHVLRHEEHKEVAAAIAGLRDTDQEVVRLKIWEGLSNEQVGQILGLTNRAVEARYTRSIKKLHKTLKSGAPAAPSSPFSAERGEAAV